MPPSHPAQPTHYSPVYRPPRLNPTPKPRSTPKAAVGKPLSGEVGTISGVVRDISGNPLDDIQVPVNGSGYGQSTCTHDSGVYSIDTVPYDLPVTVQAGGDNNCPGASQDYARQLWDHTFDGNAAAWLTLNSGIPEQPGIDFSLPLSGTASGTVTDASVDDHPLENIWVAIDVNGWGIGGVYG